MSAASRLLVFAVYANADGTYAIEAPELPSADNRAAYAPYDVGSTDGPDTPGFAAVLTPDGQRSLGRISLFEALDHMLDRWGFKAIGGRYLSSGKPVFRGQRL